MTSPTIKAPRNGSNGCRSFCQSSISGALFFDSRLDCHDLLLRVDRPDFALGGVCRRLGSWFYIRLWPPAPARIWLCRLPSWALACALGLALAAGAAANVFAALAPSAPRQLPSRLRLFAPVAAGRQNSFAAACAPAPARLSASLAVADPRLPRLQMSRHFADLVQPSSWIPATDLTAFLAILTQPPVSSAHFPSPGCTRVPYRALATKRPTIWDSMAGLSAPPDQRDECHEQSSVSQNSNMDQLVFFFVVVNVPCGVASAIFQLFGAVGHALFERPLCLCPTRPSAS